MTKLEYLIDALGKTERPTYELETAVAYVTGFWPADRIKNVVETEDGGFTVWFTAGSELPFPPPVLSSLDAAVALVNRVLPDASVLMGWSQTPQTRPWARVGPWFALDATGANQAIALVLATLKAKLSQEAKP